MALLNEVKGWLDKSHGPQGQNVREAARQPVPHLHAPAFPRHFGDRPDPRGGVRWLLPAQADDGSAG